MHPGTDAPIGRWFVGVPVPTARALVCCFPHAGGTASMFNPWRTLLAPEIELSAVQFPGREGRLDEPFYTSMDALVEAVLGWFRPRSDVPFFLFGHSNGALVAFELARALRSVRRTGPAGLVVSGCRAPHVRAARPPIHKLPETAFRQELRDFETTPRELLDQPDFMDFISPRLRADFTIYETYTYRPMDPLNVPVLALAATDDAIAPADTIEPWRQHTRSRFELREIVGGHLFVSESPLIVTQHVREFVARHI